MMSRLRDPFLLVLLAALLVTTACGTRANVRGSEKRMDWEIGVPF